MKLSQCRKGEVVQVVNDEYEGIVGHIEDFSYDLFDLEGSMDDYTNSDLNKYIKVLVKIPSGVILKFDPSNLQLFND